MKQEPITIEDLKEFFSKIVRIRTIEKAIAERYHAQEMKCPMHLSIGQEGPCSCYFYAIKCFGQNAKYPSKPCTLSG